MDDELPTERNAEGNVHRSSILLFKPPCLIYDLYAYITYERSIIWTVPTEN